MKKGIKTFCNNNGSTSTLNQQNSTTNNNNSHTSQGDFTSKVSLLSSPSSKQNSPTLEDLILQLELEEDTARKAKLSECSGIRGRMSCVNNSDILRSARNALNQYPRFSLDGRDAMYRSSFGNIEGRRSVCSETSFGGEIKDFDNNNNIKGMCCLPQTLAGESVVWRKPGVVAKLMGLEAMPVPIGSKRCETKERLSRRQSILRKRFERQQHDLERKLLTMEMQKGCFHHHLHHNIRRHTKNNNASCCSQNGYCVMKPVALEALAGGPWQPRRYAYA